MRNNCIDCGKPRGETMFLWLSDKLWEEIGCKPDEYLCAHCTINRLEKTRHFAYLIPGEGLHTIKPANATIMMHQKHPRHLASIMVDDSFEMLSEEDQDKIVEELYSPSKHIKGHVA